jgi:mannan polymerase II complex MNN10 subunit
VDYEAHTTHRDICFSKFDMTERLINSGKYDWIFWLDFDTLITNTKIAVETLIEEQLANATNPEEIDYLFTHDCNGLNAGSYLVRGHNRSMDFFRKAWAIDDEAQAKDEHMSDQDAIVKLLKTDQEAADRVHIVQQTKMNAFPEEIACFDEARQPWKHGMFVVHFAGAWAHVKGDDPTGQLMKKYEEEIIWGDWKDFYYPDKRSTIG